MTKDIDDVTWKNLRSYKTKYLILTLECVSQLCCLFLKLWVRCYHVHIFCGSKFHVRTSHECLFQLHNVWDLGWKLKGKKELHSWGLELSGGVWYMSEADAGCQPGIQQSRNINMWPSMWFQYGLVLASLQHGDWVPIVNIQRKQGWYSWDLCNLALKVTEHPSSLFYHSRYPNVLPRLKGRRHRTSSLRGEEAKIIL